MYFSSFAEFIEMGGHAFYVWLAFGFSLFWLVYLLVNPLLNSKRILREVSALQRIEQSRKNVI